MFGIFRSKEKKIGQQIGFALAQSLNMGFSISRKSRSNIFWIDDKGQFKPPYGFYDDPYIIGFIISFIGNNMMLWDSETQNFSVEKKVNLFLTAIARLAGVETPRLEKNCRHHLDMEGAGKLQPDYELGKIVALEYAFLVFESTKFLSKKTPELDKVLSIESKDLQIFIYCRDTFGRHISEKYAELFSTNCDRLEDAQLTNEHIPHDKIENINHKSLSDEERLREMSDRISKIRASHQKIQ